MPKIEPVRCVCGAPAEPWKRWGNFHVDCTRNGKICWQGPERKTRLSAVKAWNRVMTAAKEADNGRAQ